MTAWKDIECWIDGKRFEAVSIDYDPIRRYADPVEIKGVTYGEYTLDLSFSLVDWLDLFENPRGCAQARGVALGGIAFEGLRK